MKFLTLTIATAMTFGVAGNPDPASARPHVTTWNGARFCVKADKTEPTQPRNGTPFKLRATCKTREAREALGKSPAIRLSGRTLTGSS